MPPATLTDAEPLPTPQEEFVEPGVRDKAGGSVIVTVSVAVHKFASVTVTQNVPVSRLLISSLVCAHGFQK